MLFNILQYSQFSCAFFKFKWIPVNLFYAKHHILQESLLDTINVFSTLKHLITKTSFVSRRPHPLKLSNIPASQKFNKNNTKLSSINYGSPNLNQMDLNFIQHLRATHFFIIFSRLNFLQECLENFSECLQFFFFWFFGIL